MIIDICVVVVQLGSPSLPICVMFCISAEFFAACLSGLPVYEFYLIIDSYVDVFLCRVHLGL